MNGLERHAGPSTWHMYRALVGVGLVCGLLIVTVFQLTRPAIARNQAEARQRAIFQVLPGASTSAAFVVTDDDRFEKAAPDRQDKELVFAGYDEDGHLVGLAIEARGMGYQDVIRVIYGYSFDRRAIIGMRVLESRETPGLGDRIETDPAFLRNFEALDVRLTGDGSSLQHPVEAVKRGKKTSPWQVDGITGATISSEAIADMLRESSTWWIPRVVARREDF